MKRVEKASSQIEGGFGSLFNYSPPLAAAAADKQRYIEKHHGDVLQMPEKREKPPEA